MGFAHIQHQRNQNILFLDTDLHLKTTRKYLIKFYLNIILEFKGNVNLVKGYFMGLESRLHKPDALIDRCHGDS